MCFHLSLRIYKKTEQLERFFELPYEPVFGLVFFWGGPGGPHFS